MAFLLILIDPVAVLLHKLCGVPWVIKFGFASKKFWLFENRPSVRPHLHVSECKMSHFMLDLSPRYTAISRKVVGKNVHATIPKGNIGCDEYTAPDTVAVEPTFVAFL